MKILLLPFVLLSFSAFSQPPVYFNFVTHNEETFSWNNAPYYTANRARLITLAEYFQTNGITWNMQSDWVYLTNVLSQETAALTATTNNKNILRWMYEDKGVEMDPHAHESQYIYPDVVKLMDSIGLPESKLMGGTIYNDNNGINVWTNLINGQYGVVFPNFFWQPDYMMGGGTPNHVNDLKYYGFWNPQDTNAYLIHDTINHLRHIGVGCSIKIKDTSNVANVVADIKSVLENVQSGLYPSNGFYVQTIFFEQGDLNNQMFYNKVIAIADSVNALVTSGQAQWKTLKQAYTLWETAYNAQMFQWECGQIVSDIHRIVPASFNISPNPASGKIQLQIPDATETELVIYDALGIKVYQSKAVGNQIDVSLLPNGIYFCLLKLNNNEVSSTTLAVQR